MVAYKAKLIAGRKDSSDQCRSDGTGLIESGTTYIFTAPQIPQNQNQSQPWWVEQAVEVSTMRSTHPNPNP